MPVELILICWFVSTVWSVLVCMSFYGTCLSGYCRTVKVTDTEPYYIRATFPPLRHSVVFIVRETPLYT